MESAKITHVDIYKFDIPFWEPFVISLGPITCANNIVVKINTDNDLYGFGECSTITYISGESQETEFILAQSFARLLKGKDPFAIEERLREMDHAIAGNYTLKSAFDMALYDLMAKRAGMPLFCFLGGSITKRIHTDMTVSINTPDYMAQKALKYKNDGFQALKVKLGTTTETDVARIKAIREAVGKEMPLRIDANQGWDPVTAIKTLKALEPYDIEHCEEPVKHWNNRELARVRANSPIPIMADESLFTHHDAFRLAVMGACDYFNVKLSKSGGIHNALKICDIAEGAGIKCQVGCMNESRFALTALTHLASSKDIIVHYDIDSSYQHTVDPVIGGIENIGCGEWKLPVIPGIGADFDPAYLAGMESVTI